MNALYLMIWMAIGGYVIGKRRGKGARYAVLSIPVALATYVVTFMAVGALS